LLPRNSLRQHRRKITVQGSKEEIALQSATRTELATRSDSKKPEKNSNPPKVIKQMQESVEALRKTDESQGIPLFRILLFPSHTLH
jgi:hypothetical protein